MALVTAARFGIFSTLLGVCGVAASTGATLAAWTEAGTQILTLSEARPQIESALGVRIQTSLDAETPLLVDPGADPASPATWHVALVASGLSVRDDGGEARILSRLEDERSHASARRTTLVPTSAAGQPDAVSHGGLVFYGKWVAPPYAVSVTSTAVQINGVPVFPPPGANVALPQPTREQIEAHETLEAATERFLDERITDPEGARESLAAELLSLPQFVSAEWVSEQSLRLTDRNGDPEYVSFGERREADPPDGEAQRAFLTRQAELFRAALRDGVTLVAGATYMLPILDVAPDVLRDRIGEIRDSGENDAIKIARVQAHIGHRDAAVDIVLAN